MSTTEKTMACAVCGYVLENFTKEGQVVGWMHITPRGDDHVVIPVDANTIETNEKCDFCSAESVAWILPVKTFEIVPATSVMPGQMSHGAWAACVDCGHLIGMNKWSALITRVRQRALFPVPRGALEYLYERLQVNILEEPVPYSEWRARHGGSAFPNE